MSTAETEAQVDPTVTRLEESSQPRACGVTSRIWLRCVHAVAMSLFLSFLQQKHIFYLVGLGWPIHDVHYSATFDTFHRT